MSILTRRNLLGAVILLIGFGAYVNIQYNTYLFQLRGLTPRQIGWMGALGAIPSLFTPLLAGWLLDRSPDPRRLLVTLSVLAAAALAVLPHLPGSFLAIGTGFFLMQCVLVPLPSLTTSLLVEKGTSRSQSVFLVLRAMGTLGFFLVSLFLYFWSPRVTLSWVYGLLALVLIVNIPFLLQLKPVAHDPEASPAPSLRESFSLLWHPGLLAVYLTGALAYLSVGLGQSLLGNLVTSKEMGGHSWHINLAWCFSTLPELGFMFLGIPFLRRFGLKSMVLVGIFSNALRWFWVSQAPDLPQIYASQTLHGIMVVGLMTGQSLCLARLLPPGRQASGMAVASILNGGVAGILGSSIAGWIWQTWSLRTVYGVAGIVLTLSGILFWFFVPNLERIEAVKPA
jgi:MFS transporter, PPP family, 3-phenylpropionic acid transporter